jgi:hypothetical protein
LKSAPECRRPSPAFDQRKGLAALDAGVPLVGWVPP